MSTYKTLIIDDEPISRRITKNFLSQIDNYEVVGEAADAKVGFTEVMKKDVDLLFLDIEMPEISGLDFLRSLANPPKVIIISAHRQYAIEGFDLNVVDYLLKPVAIDRFKLALQKFEEQVEQKKEIQHFKDDYLFIRSERKHYKIDFKSITFIESQGDYLIIKNTKGDTWKTKETIGGIADRLPHYFLRIHRSFIVNMDHVTALNREVVEIEKEMLPVSKSFRESVLQFFEKGK
ncbi:LytR/AlgR family response regulator transcription factor [Flammeovirga kamogawensis]|uniref:Response regulator transcription factor n=1 Tax=Flammeovirga kamogawensis TaxID=373891 RepID=A0ABX8GUU3_9BACT|nr:response regulator transcription factor [Flammeovirga kamogawensis]MBB6463315.1 DNA-binding LytR/AlgR family response regulator [Flammeovirga kamogawensis]QWG06710.1 response regulator transcription factor [Flammeovirga kamogawensis]TRX68532.1 response regulator transcription factor [Flammeovirga kamogawensis]